MGENNRKRSIDKDTSKMGFVTHAQVQSLTDEEKTFEATCISRGVWLELFCPDDACFREEERISIPIFCKDPNAGKKLWLKLFCPEDSCEVHQSTQLP